MTYAYPYTPYAVEADVVGFMSAHAPIPNPPYDTAEINRLILRACELVDNWLNKYAFATDTIGNPTDPTVLNALNGAVCAQVESWILSGDELNEMGQWSEFSVEGVTMTRSGDSDTVRRQRLCARAYDYLQSIPASTGPGTGLMSKWVGVP